MSRPLRLTGAAVLRPGGLSDAPLSITEGRIADGAGGREIDLSGFRVLPGIVDAHGDGFERHVAPRRGAMTEVSEGLRAAETEIAACGITTAVVAQFWSWEGGLRGPGFAGEVFAALQALRGEAATSLIPQMRFETHLLEDYDRLPDLLAGWGVDYLVFNDHLPHDRLAEGRRPQRLTGQALKAGQNPEHYLARMQELHRRSGAVPAALDALCARLAGQGVRMGSHDDRTSDARAAWSARGVRIAEFPETREAAQAARAAGDAVVMGAPNCVRGGSHLGNVSARTLAAEGLCDALASDYHYPSPRRAALMLEEEIGLEAAWALVSDGPARALGLADRGRIAPGLRADLVVLDEAGRVGATLAGGRVTYMAGEAAERLMAA